MSYLGSAPQSTAATFAGVYSQSFSGNGSSTTFTLGRYVAQVANIEVIVNNVQQSPFDSSYTLSGGTSLVFSEAPSAGTNNIYVVYRDYPVQTLTDTGSVRKTGDTMSGSYTLNGVLTIETQTTANGGYPLYIRRSGTDKEALTTYITTGGTNFYVGHDNDSTTNFGIGPETAYPAIKIDTSSRVTKPYQPAFCAHDDGSSAYSANSTIIFNTVKFNTGSHYSNSTGRFTAPVAGKYFFYAQFLGEASANTRTIAYLSLNGSQGASDQTVEISATTKDYNSAQGTTIMNLAAGDYVSVITSGTNNPYAGSSFQNIFCGYLLG
jgi:hypothetical protein